METIIEQLTTAMMDNDLNGFQAILSDMTNEEWSNFIRSENGGTPLVIDLFLEADSENEDAAQILYNKLCETNSPRTVIGIISQNMELGENGVDNNFLLAVSYADAAVLQDVMTNIYGNEANTLIEMYSILPQAAYPIRRAIDLDKFDVINVINNACGDQFRSNFTAFVARNMREDDIVDFDYAVSPEKLREETMFLASTLPECDLRTSVIGYYNQQNPGNPINETRITKFREINQMLSQEPSFAQDSLSKNRAIFNLIENNQIIELSSTYIAMNQRDGRFGLSAALESPSRIVAEFLTPSSQLNEAQQESFARVMHEFFTAQNTIASTIQTHAAPSNTVESNADLATQVQLSGHKKGRSPDNS